MSGRKQNYARARARASPCSASLRVRTESEETESRLEAMDPPHGNKEEREQMDAWFGDEGLGPGSPGEARLALLWRFCQLTRSQLSRTTRELDAQREVRKSLEQIRVFTDHKDALAQEIQDENDQLKDQVRRQVSLQDAQVSEVAKMLYQQGLTELVHSSCSEQVAYLLVERASLLEMSDPPGEQRPVPNTDACQSPHKGAPRHCQSPWKRLFGLHKASQSKCTFIPIEARHFPGQASGVEREMFRLERDLEEASRRLAMSHGEIRRLTEELESARLTPRAYEPELQAAQHEVEQLRQEVEKLKKYEMVELRKAKEMNDRLDLEIRALRTRVRSLDAEKSSLQHLVVRLQKEVEELESELQKQQKLPTVQVEVRELPEVACLQREVLELASQEQQQEQQQQLQAARIEANQANKAAESLNLTQRTCRDLQKQLSIQTRCLLEKDSEILSLKQNLDDLTATTCTENNLQDQTLWKPQEEESQRCENTHQHLQEAFTTGDEEQQTQKECSDYQETGSTQTLPQDECRALKKEICEAITCLDTERSKYHKVMQKHKARLSRAKQKLGEETRWRNDKIKNLERELSLCSHSLAKELAVRVAEENEKLLGERRKLLQHLNEEEQSKKEVNLTAGLTKSRVEFLETENKKLGNKIVHMSDQLGVLERTVQNMKSHHFAEALKKNYSPQQFFSHRSLRTSSVMMPVAPDDTGSGRTKQTEPRRPPAPRIPNPTLTHSSSSSSVFPRPEVA